MSNRYRLRAIILSALLVGSVFAFGGVTQAQSTPEVTIDALSENRLDGSGTVSLVAQNVGDNDDVGAFEIEVKYNATLVSLSASDSESFSVSADLGDQTGESTATIVGYTGSVDGTSGTVNLAELGLTATDGSEGNTTRLEITSVSVLADVDGNDLGSTTVQPGSFEIGSIDEEAPEPDPGTDPDTGDGGGGGGGGGGGAGTGGDGGGVDVPDISDDLGDDAEISDESEGVITSDPATGGSTVEFSGTSNVESISFSGEVEGTAVVRNIDGTPAATGSPPGIAVSISDITVPEDARDSPATIRKRVSNEQLNDVGVEANSLAVYRFNDGEWNQLDTEVASETDSGAILEAETPGFSVFAVATVEDAPADGGADGGADDTETEPESGGGLSPTILGLIGLVIVIAVAVGIYATQQQD